MTCDMQYATCDTVTPVCGILYLSAAKLRVRDKVQIKCFGSKLGETPGLKDLAGQYG